VDGARVVEKPEQQDGQPRVREEEAPGPGERPAVLGEAQEHVDGIDRDDDAGDRNQ
jgi:hypothetical protein